MDKNKLIAKNTITSYVRMFLTMLITFFTTRITLDVLGVENYGIYNVVCGVVVMFAFVSTSMGTAVQRFCSIEIGRKDQVKLKNVFGVSIFLHILIAAVMLIAVEVFACFFFDRLEIPAERMSAAFITFQISIISFVLGILIIPYQALLRSREEFSNIAYIEIANALFRLGVIYGLLHINYDKLIVYATLVMTVTVISYALYFCLARKYNETHVLPLYDKEIIKEMGSFTILGLMGISAMMFRDQLIIVFINLFLGLTVNAAYAIAVTIKNAVEQFTTSFRQAVVPQLMSSYGEGNYDRMNKLMYVGSKVTFALSLMLMIPLSLEMEYLLTLWLKEPPLYSPQMGIWIMAFILVTYFTYFMEQAIHATGKIKMLQYLSSTIYVLNIAAMYVGLKYFDVDYNYIFICLILFSILKCMAVIACANRVIEFSVPFFIRDYFFRSVVTLFVSILPLAICFIMNDGFLRLVVVTIVSLMFTLGASYIILLNHDEQYWVMGYISKFIKNRIYNK